jgi:hypothetical protein
MSENQNNTPAVLHAESSGMSVWNNQNAFAEAWKMANVLASTSIVPEAYQGKPANCLVALEMSNRIGVSPMMVMQNLDIIYGRPAWRSTFVLSVIKTCGQYSDVRYEWAGQQGHDSYGCRLVATDNHTGKPVYGEWVTVGIAKAEGWYGRKGSKWTTMPGQMLGYRAASWFGRMHCPEILLGMHSVDEVQEVQVVESAPAVKQAAPEVIPAINRGPQVAKGQAGPMNVGVTTDEEVI